MPDYSFQCDDCDAHTEVWDMMRDCVSIGEYRTDGHKCPSCGSKRLRRTLLKAPATKIGEGEGDTPYEQVWYDNGDGKTITVEPAAKSLKDSHRKVIPKTSAMPKGPNKVPNPKG